MSCLKMTDAKEKTKTKKKTEPGKRRSGEFRGRLQL